MPVQRAGNVERVSPEETSPEQPPRPPDANSHNEGSCQPVGDRPNLSISPALFYGTGRSQNQQSSNQGQESTSQSTLSDSPIDMDSNSSGSGDDYVFEDDSSDNMSVISPDSSLSDENVEDNNSEVLEGSDPFEDNSDPFEDDSDPFEDDNDPFEYTDGDTDDGSDSNDMDFDVSMFSLDSEENTSDEDSDLPEDPNQREILGSVVEPGVSLHVAALQGNSIELARWKAWGTGVWARKVKGDTELHFAARSGDVSAVEQLVLQGTPLNVKNKKRHTPLEVAAFCGHAAVVKKFLQHGAGQEVEQMEHALLAAKSSSVIRVLAEDDEDAVRGVVGADVLSRMARDGRVVMLQALLKAGADPNWPGPFSRTALHTAASRGHVRCVLALLEYGGDVTCVDDRLWTPLHYAANYGHGEVVRELLRAGSNPASRNCEGHRPVDLTFDDSIRQLLVVEN